MKDLKRFPLWGQGPSQVGTLLGLKWLIISTLALALILAVYELLIRRVNAMHWLFGMKPHQRTPREDRNGKEQEEHKASHYVC